MPRRKCALSDWLNRSVETGVWYGEDDVVYMHTMNILVTEYISSVCVNALQCWAVLITC